MARPTKRPVKRRVEDAPPEADPVPADAGAATASDAEPTGDTPDADAPDGRAVDGGTTAPVRREVAKPRKDADRPAAVDDAPSSPTAEGASGSRRGRQAVKKLPKKEVRGTPGASSRYTPPTARAEDLPSPTWVPVLMFVLWGLGALAIFLNYVGLLPGATSNWYLLLGLGFILGGIITATQYR